VGIELDHATREALVAAGKALRAAVSDWAAEKWVRGENLHVTVAFLGDVDAGVVPEMTAAIARELSAVQTFELPCEGLRAVPNPRRASMLWAAYSDPEGSAASLSRAIGRATGSLADAPSPKRFKAHITLVRARRARRVDAQTAQLMESMSSRLSAFMSVPSVTLFSSTLTKAGPQYRSISTWTLRRPEKGE